MKEGMNKSMEYVLTTENLSKIYGAKKAVDKVNIHVKKEIFTVLSEKTEQEKPL